MCQAINFYLSKIIVGVPAQVNKISLLSSSPLASQRGNANELPCVSICRVSQLPAESSASAVYFFKWTKIAYMYTEAGCACVSLSQLPCALFRWNTVHFASYTATGESEDCCHGDEWMLKSARSSRERSERSHRLRAHFDRSPEPTLNIFDSMWRDIGRRPISVCRVRRRRIMCRFEAFDVSFVRLVCLIGSDLQSSFLKNFELGSNFKI